MKLANATETCQARNVLTTRALLEANALTAAAASLTLTLPLPLPLSHQADLISKAIYSYENKRHIRKTTSTVQSNNKENGGGEKLLLTK